MTSLPDDNKASTGTSVDFTYDPSCASFAVPLAEHLSSHANANYTHIVVGALVFSATTTTNETTNPRVLLVQRSAGDSFPNCWEVPGGLCDDDDLSVLHAVARELREETGFKTTHIGLVVGKPHFFSFGSGTKVCRVVFVVEVERDGSGGLEPVLNVEEHQRFVWAKESEVREARVGDIELEFTNEALKDTILTAFHGVKVG